MGGFSGNGEPVQTEAHSPSLGGSAQAEAEETSRAAALLTVMMPQEKTAMSHGGEGVGKCGSVGN